MKPVSRYQKQSQGKKHSKVSILLQESSSKRNTSKKKLNLSNLWIIPEQAIFCYQSIDQQVLYAKINLNNQTQCKIFFQLVPSYQNYSLYMINLLQQVLPINQAIQITIGLNKKSKSLKMSRFDCFQLSWGSVPEMPGIPIAFTHTHKIPVKFILKSSQHNHLTLTKPQKIYKTNSTNILHFYQQKIQQKELLQDIYKRNNQDGRKKQYQLEKKILEKSQNKNKTTLLTQCNMILVAVVFFLIGFLGT